MTPAQGDAELTKKAILDAAEGVFLEQGFARAPMSEIARRAGVAKSLLHHHFGSKQSLWTKVKRRRFTVYEEQQLRMLEESEPHVGLLRESIITLFNFMKSNPELVRIMAWVYLERDTDPCLETHKELTTRGAEVIQKAQEEGLLRKDIDASSILITFIGIIQHYFQEHSHYRQEFKFEGISNDEMDERFLDDFLKIYMEGVLPR